MTDFARALRHLRPAEPPQRHLFQPAPVFSISRQLEFLKARSSEPSMGHVSVRTEVVPGGEEEVTPLGRHTVLRKVYPHDYYHGKIGLGRFSCSDLKQLISLMREKGSVPDRDSILFLDTETTGIQGGAGMCPFLVGIGYYSGDDFHMVQYFIRDFDEEPSMLYSLAKLSERFRMVVTYNGAAFDIPLLETRFTLARLDSPFPAMSHLDLLTSARRLWRAGHGSCRLVALEKEIVSFLRGPDVPGSMIPRAYFDYLLHGSSPALQSVFKHNIHDVVSLAALTVAACDRVTAEPASFDDPLDLYSLARILENTAEWNRAAILYEMALAGGLPESVRIKAIENLIVIYRRAGEHERSLARCDELINGSAFSFPAYEGAAIYHERIACDHARALEIVERALLRIELNEETQRWRTSLKSRWERLRQKALRFPSKP